jgi:hypothetical protein
VDPLRRNPSTEQPSGACASEPPDPARGGYADYVERLEDQIAGRVPAGGEPRDQAAARPAPAA